MVEAAVAREQAERRNTAIAFAIAVNAPKELDKVLPAPKGKEEAAPRQDFVQDNWWPT